MSPGASSQNSKSKSSAKRNVDFDENDGSVVKERRTKKVDEGDDFDVVESDPVTI
jgi:hypothetical protein